MPAPALKVLQETFGFSEFRLHQGEVIASLLAGRNAIVIMPTGSGKSLCYQIPALVLDGTGIVVSPLIALMKDQVDALHQHGIRAAALNSSRSPQEQQHIRDMLHNGSLDLLYISPERLLTEATLNDLQQAKIAFFAVDEAHCVSRWGHDFRPEYAQLSALAEHFAEVPRIALTATADELTRKDIARNLHLQGADTFIAGYDRPNIFYAISDAGNARQKLLELIRQRHPNDAGIVYCLSRNKVDQTAEWLCQQGLTALAYHAGMDRADREQTHNRFLREDGVIVVATIAFGMGIDKPDVRFVAHLNLPKSVESYYQETGRAGRDGLPATAWMSYGFQDVMMLMQMLDNSEADEEFKRIERQKINSLLGLCETAHCRRQSLLNYFGESHLGGCGNCDNCLQPPETWDGTEAAQKALSCVYRTGQRFGVAHLVDVLRGGDSEKIHRFGHQKLSVYGVGADLTPVEWRSVIRQLAAGGFLTPDPEGHGGLRLTPASWPVLKSEQQVRLRKLPKAKATTRAPTERHVEPLSPTDAPLFEHLRTLRKELADTQSVPAYVIFANSTLESMARHKPGTLEEMAAVPGVGQVKLERYGQAFLKAIADFTTANA